MLDESSPFGAPKRVFKTDEEIYIGDRWQSDWFKAKTDNGEAGVIYYGTKGQFIPRGKLPTANSPPRSADNAKTRQSSTIGMPSILKGVGIALAFLASIGLASFWKTWLSNDSHLFEEMMDSQNYARVLLAIIIELGLPLLILGIGWVIYRTGKRIELSKRKG